MLLSLTPAQVLNAYGINHVMFGSTVGNGAGQTIAIIDPGDDPNISSDLATFDGTYGLPAPPSFAVTGENGTRPLYPAITGVSASGGTVTITTASNPGLSVNDFIAVSGVANTNYNGTFQVTSATATSFQYSDAAAGTGSSTGGTLTNPVNSGETAGDVEWSHSIAPGARIVLIEMSAFTGGDIVNAVTKAVPPSGASVVSMSFGGLEYAGETGSSSTSQDDGIYTQAGVTYVDDSGDNGAPGWYSSYSPNVLGAAATNLYLNPDGSYSYETGWSNPAEIASARESGSTVTITTEGSFGFSAGNTIRVAGVGATGYDGTYTILATPTSSSFTYTDGTTGLANSVGGSAIVLPSIVDNSSGSGFAQTGTWTQSSSGGYLGNFQTASPGANTATWSFSVPKNTNLGISLTWVAAGGNATNASYSFYDGSVSPANLIASYTANQTVAPNDNTGTSYDPTTPFQKIADFVQSTTGTIIAVLNASGASGTVCADAVAVSNDGNGGGSGGGISQFESQPVYQNGIVSAFSTTQRTVPDVAFLGGGNTPVNIVDSFGGATTFAGTSLSTPCWAGLAAIVDQGLVLRGQGTLSSSSPTAGIQALLYKLPGSDFHDIISGYNGYNAGAGYDLVTGLGTPLANLLVPDLAGTSIDYTVPSAGSPHQLVLRKNGTNVELLDNGVVVDSAPLATLSDVNITDPNSSNDSLTVDYAYQGIFAAQVNFNHTVTSGYQTVAVNAPNGPSNAVSVSENPDVRGAGSIVVDGATQTIDFENASEVDVNAGSGGDAITLNGDGGKSGLQTIHVQGGAGNDSLAVNSSNGLLALPNGVQYDGGAGFNSLTLDQSPGTTGQTSNTYSVGPNVGQGMDVLVGPSGTQTIYFQNLAPTFDSVPATTLTVNATDAANAINYTTGKDSLANYYATPPVLDTAWGEVSVDNQEPIEFTAQDHLVINGLAGSDQINLNNPNTPTGDSSTGLLDITVSGGDPTASDMLVANGTVAADTINFAPSAADAGKITGAGPVPIFFNTIEQVVINGQGGGDSLTVTTPAGLQVVTVTPGALADEGQVTLRNATGAGGGGALVGLSFTNIGANGSLSIADVSGTRVDNLTILGTDASNRFNVSAAGDVTLNTFTGGGSSLTLVPVHTPGVVELGLEGFAGDDYFNVTGSIPFTGGLLLDGGDPSASDTVNLTGATGAVGVKVADSTLSTFTTVSGYGATVTLLGIEVVNLNAGGNPLTVTGTAGNDLFNFSPTALGAGTFQVTTTGAAVGTSPQFSYTGVGGSGITLDGGTGGYDTLGLSGTPGNDDIGAVQTDATHLIFDLNAFTQHFIFAAVASVQAVDIAAGAGDDTITITVADALESAPAGSLRFDVDGGPPNASDHLFITDDGPGDLTILREAPDGRSGSATVGALNPVVYENIERVDVTPVDPSTGGTGGDGDGRILVLHSDPFEYNDTILNATQLARVPDYPNSPTIDPAGFDQDWYQFRPQATGTFQVKILFDMIGTLANGRPGLPDSGNLALNIYDATGALITSGVAVPGGVAAVFAATNDPAFSKYNRIYVQVLGAAPGSINVYDFDNLAGVGTGIPGVSNVDVEGPQVTDVSVNNIPTSTYNLFGLKTATANALQGPTPLVDSLLVHFQDLPARAPGFLYPALDYTLTADQARGLFQVTGDSNGIVAIDHVVITEPPPGTGTVGQVPTATIELVFAQPLPDDRYTLTINDSLRDPAGNKLDGESNANEPNGAPNFPSGDGFPGGDFVARFTVDSRPEIGTWSGGSEYIDTNGNNVWDPANPDASNRDITYVLGLASDKIFAGNFAYPAIGTGAGDGFSKLAAYGKNATTGQFRFLFTNDAGVVTWITSPIAQINGLPVAGNFSNNPALGDTVGLFDGTNWWLDTTGGASINLTTKVAASHAGYPIVGDFDGDGHTDLCIYSNGVFYFQLWSPTIDPLHPAYGHYNILRQLTFGSNNGIQLGALARPVAADMDHDGITDVGLFVPDGSGATGTQAAEWYWLLSNDPATNTSGTPLIQKRIVGQVNTLNHLFSPTPLGNDLFAKFGNNYALPVVGNFDPPVNTAGFPASPLTVDLVGTAGNDKFTFGPGTAAGTWVASVNGATQTFTAASIQVNFNGLGGKDTATIQGSGAGQSVTLRPGSGDASGAGYGVHVVAESITVNAGGGAGQVAMYGVAGKKNYFSGTDTAAVMSDSPTGAWTNYYDRAAGFHTVNAYSTPGNSDVATLYGSATDVFTGTATTAQFSYDQVNLFRYVTAYGGSVANLYAAGINDTFFGNPSTASLAGANYSDVASGFKSVNAYGVVGGKNTAQVTDGGVKSLLETSQDMAQLSTLNPKTADYALAMFDFAQVTVSLKNKSSATDLAQTIDFLLTITK